MSVAIVALGLVVLVGWHARIGAAVQIVPGLLPRQYNTALCFLAALMGGAVILEYATGVSFGIDTLFFHSWITTSGTAGRMAAITAVSFALAGRGGALPVHRGRKCDAFLVFEHRALHGLTNS
jgi:hypothetical protein